jgi:hypothetical protein
MGFELFIDLRIEVLLHYPKLRKRYLATFSNTEKERGGGERERERRWNRWRNVRVSSSPAFVFWD